MLTAHEHAQNLMADTLSTLEDDGWHKTRVDTYEHPDHPGHTIRHHYSGGEYTLVHSHAPTPGTASTETIRWSVHRELPTPEQILTQILTLLTNPTTQE